MKIYKLLYIGLVFILLSCDKNEESDPKIKYQGEHKLFINEVKTSGFGSVEVTGTFNITSDPSIIDVGFMLLMDGNIVDKKSFDKEKLHSIESALFTNLDSGDYEVVAYLRNEQEQIISSSKKISLNVDRNAELMMSSYSYDYEDSNGNLIISSNNGKNFTIFLISKIPLIVSQMRMIIGDQLVSSAQIDASTGWSDGYYHYNFYLKITDEIPKGKHEIKLLLDEGLDPFSLNLFLDNLEGRWTALSALFTGDLLSGRKVAFQNEKYGFLVKNLPDSYYSEELQVWRIDFSTLRWTQMSSLKIPEQSNIKLYPTQITLNNKAYIVLRSAYDVDIWEYDMTTDKWSRKMKSDEKLSLSPIVFSHKNRFHFIWEKTDKHLIFDFEKNVCIQTKSPELLSINYQSANFYSTFESPNYSYIVTGSYSGWNHNVLRYSEDLKIFEDVTSPYPMMSGNGIGYYHNNSIYYIGGRITYDQQHPYCYRFQEKSKKWEQISDFPYNISEGITFNINEKVYVGLGNNYYDTKISMFTFEDDN